MNNSWNVDPALSRIKPPERRLYVSALDRV
jgi:hypothetical protein